MPAESCGCDPTWVDPRTKREGWFCQRHTRGTRMRFEEDAKVREYVAIQNQWDAATQKMREELHARTIQQEEKALGVTKGIIGIGGAPTRATILPEAAAERKQYPMATGLLFYFPDALAAVANVSWKGNEQHNPGMPLHWDRSKSGDEADTAVRHLSQSGTLDKDGTRHTAKAAWRILALLQKEIVGESR